MKRSLVALFLLFLAFPLVGGPGPQDPPCPTSLPDCPDEGCGKKFDPNLNLRKNIRSDDQTARWQSEQPPALTGGANQNTFRHR